MNAFMGRTQFHKKTLILKIPTYFLDSISHEHFDALAYLPSPSVIIPLSWSSLKLRNQTYITITINSKKYLTKILNIKFCHSRTFKQNHLEDREKKAN